MNGRETRRKNTGEIRGADVMYISKQGISPEGRKAATRGAEGEEESEGTNG